MSTRFGAAATRAVESILEQARADLERQRRAMGIPVADAIVAAWEAMPDAHRRLISTIVANSSAAALLEVVRRSDDDETTDRKATPICPNCGGGITRRCVMCGWWGQD